MLTKTEFDLEVLGSNPDAITRFELEILGSNSSESITLDTGGHGFESRQIQIFELKVRVRIQDTNLCRSRFESQ